MNASRRWKISADTLIRTAYALLGAASLAVAAPPAAASEVTQVRDGLTLRATLELAPGRTLADGLVLLVHGTMGHRDMEVMRQFRRLLRERGHNTLAINLSLGLDRREGMFDCATPSRHRAADALAEIGVWLDWAAREGARRVTLAGFSRGAQQAAWFAAERRHPALARLVLLAPIFAADSAERYAERFGAPLAPVLAEARALAAAGRGAELLGPLGFLNCERSRASAEALLSYYAPEPSSELPATLARIAVPVLVVLAGGDEIVREAEKRVAPLADGRRVRMAVIAGSDHFFRDLYGEDAADAVHAFLRQD